MNISAYQWFIIIALDIVIRASYFFVTSLNVLNIPIALVLSMMHLTLLILIYYSAASLEWPERTAAAVTILLTNTLFCSLSFSSGSISSRVADKPSVLGTTVGVTGSTE